MMENLALYIVVTLFVSSITFILRQITKRLDKQEEDMKNHKIEIDDKVSKTYETIRAEYKDLIKVIELNKKEILNTLKKSSSDSIGSDVCSLKQELWNSKFNNVLEKFDLYLSQNEKEHKTLVTTINTSTSSRTEQMVDLSERVSELSKCVRKLQLKEKC